MNFAQYLAADDGTGGAHGDCPPEMICFEDGTMMTADEFRTRVITPNVGVRHSPSGIQGPSNPHLTWADATGGGFRGGQRQEIAPVYGDQTGGPQPYGPTSTPERARAFAALIDELRRRGR